MAPSLYIHDENKDVIGSNRQNQKRNHFHHN